MRLKTATLALAAPGFAQTARTLQANPVPIVEAEINGQPVRLEVDLRLPDVLLLDPATADRLGVRRVPFAAVAVDVDGGASIRGRLARPRIVFGDRETRAFAGIFPTPMTVRADGLIGPGVLPYEVITITFGAERIGAHDRVFTLDDVDEWKTRSSAGGEAVDLTFDLGHEASTLNRSATHRFGDAHVLRASGGLREAELVLGLRTMMQPVDNELAVSGLGLGPTLARTNAPLLGAADPDAIVVRAEREANAPEITLGRAALERCNSVSVDRRSRRLTLRCAN